MSRRRTSGESRSADGCAAVRPAGGHRERREHTVLEVDGAPGLVHGDVDEGYGAVADACRRNVAERGEIGAAGVVHRNGREVVDL